MDVGGWLRGLGLGQYEEKFRDNKIDADLLPRLTVDDLKDIGVSVVGDRRRLLDAIAVVAGAGPPPDLPASPTKFATTKDLQASAERRPITVMFCDLVGSTSLAAKLDAEDWRTLVNAYLDEASAAVTGLGGHVLKKLGDGLMALFGYPHAQENDAERAVRAALAIQRALSDLNARNAANGAPELSARIGLDSGQVVVDATGEVFGDAPNLAARVQAAAEPGSVLITGNVQRHVAGLFVVEEKGAHELKGVAQPLSLYRVVRVSGGGRRGGMRALTQFVGREEELGLLARGWERARVGEGQLVLIVGEPGLGKSRLIEEVHARLEETPHTWVEWSASQLLQNTPLHPIAEWGRQRFGLDAPAEQRLADLEDTLGLIGLDPAEHAPLLAPLVDIPLPHGRAANFSPEELRRRQLAAMTAWVLAGARSQPAVVAFEDLHWADPTSLDLLRALAERGAQAPLLLLATTRPEFRPPWSLRSHHSVLSLSPLDRAGVARMVGEISARHALSNELIEGVNERTGGVPLFVEEVTRLLVERGEQGGVQAIPPTLQQSLAARLDRLGAAREVAQIGAVLGRDFTYLLLRDVAEADEPTLQASLDRLAAADLLFVEGAPPQTTYRFKHALIQDAAYDSLLKSRRQSLHRRAAEALRDANAEPEAIAHHFTQAGLDDPAIEWWGKAGDQALRRSAFQEAIAHLGKAIAMADRNASAAPRDGVGDATVSSERLKLQTDYRQAMMWSKGFAAEETKTAFARAAELAGRTDDFSERSTALQGQFAAAITAGELRSARELALTLLREAEDAGEAIEAGNASGCLGLIAYFCGDFLEARTQCERALDGENSSWASSFLAATMWQLGEVERARELINSATRCATEIGHIGAIADALFWKSYLEVWRSDPVATLSAAEALESVAREHGMVQFFNEAELHSGWAQGRINDPMAGAAQVRRVLAAFPDQGVRINAGLYGGLLAQLEAETLGAESALARIDEALGLSGQVEHHCSLPFLHRLRGEILLKRDPTNPAPAEEEFRTAIAIAQEQGARSPHLIAALALAKLYQSTGRPAKAHAVLAPALKGFSPTPEMPEIAEAQALLAAMAETEEVKAGVVQQQRRLHLQTAYGQAVMWSKGFGAEETKAAFARAAELAAKSDDFSERFAAAHGQWTIAILRSELRSAHELAAAFLRQAEEAGRMTEVGVARRGLGLISYFLGDFIEARSHCERALASCDSEHEEEARERYGEYTGTFATAFLANASWQLGDVERARELMETANRRAAELGHVPSMANPLFTKSYLAILRGDAPAALSAAAALEALAQEQGMALQRTWAEMLAGWARGRLGDTAANAAQLRQGLVALAEHGQRLDQPFYSALLAQLEAETLGAERALARIDEALARAQQIEQRCNLVFMYRLRGEILLKRDPNNPAPAEDSFKTAIGIAKDQGARSLGLQAAFALAKLFQATARPVEAHAILAPAVDGFTLTPEMPETAEAQVLLAALAETDEVRAEAAKRERRFHLQTTYGQAVMLSKGFAAEETKDAFARARELAGGTENPAERFPAYFAQWVRSLARGEHRRAQEAAETFLREAEEGGYATEAGFARRCLGASCCYQGKLLEAQTHLERALADYQPDRDARTRFRFGHDTRILATANLATTTWHLGQVERARQLAEQAVQSATELGHVPSSAFAHVFKTGLEILRNDPGAALRSAETLLALVREHGMEFFVAVGEAYAGWARGRLDDPQAGAQVIRRALAEQFNETNRINAPLFHGLLAELEAVTRGPDAALTLIDQGLAAAQETGEHYTDPYLHRLRGEVLFRRDPANPVPVEEAFQTAITIAKQQGARSHGLRAAVSLAKRYQSTSRLAEAQAVLAPALEGFAPTPEMPEIAEAQALLGAIEAGAHVKHE